MGNSILPLGGGLAGQQQDHWRLKAWRAAGEDRAVFHFMVAAADRDCYLTVLRRTLAPGGHLILATFGPDGPTRCSGLPVVHYGPDALSHVVGVELELVSSRLEQHLTPAGRNQQFLYAHLRRKPPAV
jgi:hypothetical protein